jgi:RNA polymerase sigma factor (sigma-70 family)
VLFAPGYFFSRKCLDVAWRFLGDFHRAEDAVQDALVRAFLDLPKLRDPAAFPGWFRRIVRGCCYRLVRGKSLSIVALDDELMSDDPGPELCAEVRDVHQRVWDAICRLPERERLKIIFAIWPCKG